MRPREARPIPGDIKLIFVEDYRWTIRVGLKLVWDPIRDKEPVAWSIHLVFVDDFAMGYDPQSAAWILRAVFRVHMWGNSAAGRENGFVHPHRGDVDGKLPFTNSA